MGRKKIKYLLVFLALFISCTVESDKSITDDIYYEISSEQDDGGTYYSVATSRMAISDSNDTSFWSLAMNKIIYVEPHKETVLQTLHARHAGIVDYRPVSYLIESHQNKFYAYGFINGIKTFFKNSKRPKYQEISPSGYPVYLADYELQLEYRDLKTLNDIENLFLVVETSKTTREGLPITLEVEVKESVLDTLKLMALDKWKNQLERVRQESGL